jgi:hypothetical protein
MKKLLIISAMPVLLAVLLPGFASGQTTADYFLVPGDSVTVPEGYSQQLSIWSADYTGNLHEGVSDITKTIPGWYLNGKEPGKENPDEGKLSVSLPIEHASYTAPQSLPPQNPVMVSVNFRANDTTKEQTTLLCMIRVIAPKNKWYISYTCSSYKYSSKKSSSDNSIDESQASGNASLVVDAPPADASGYIHFDAPGQDKLENQSVSGSMSENSSDISRDLNGAIIEKTIRKYSGEADHQNAGIEFEYDPEHPHDVGLNAGILFNVKGTDKFWKWDYDSHSLKLVDTDNHSENDKTDMLLGTVGQSVKKTKTGFTIDYSAGKDTSYTDMLGTEHVERSGLSYHVNISYIKGNNQSSGKKND